MHGFYSFDLASTPARLGRDLVLFCATSAPSEGDIIDCCRRYCAKNLTPNKILILGSSVERSKLQSIVKSRSFKQRLRGVTRYLDTPDVTCSYFKTDGEVKIPEIERIKRIGMTTIFRGRGAMLASTSSYHFLKPSQSHADLFVRAGSALVDGSEIAFLAFCCLPFFPNQVENVYCDTGAISALVFAVSSLRQKLNRGATPLLASSYGSYKGMKDFPFEKMTHSLVFISASTSGNMAQDLSRLRPEIKSEKVITLFFLGKSAPVTNTVCDLSHCKSSNPSGYPAIVSEPADNCSWCNAGSVAIELAGDHFLPQGAHVESILISVDDTPDWFNPLLHQFVGKGLITANYSEGHSQGATKQVFLDSQRMFESKNFLNITGADRLIRKSLEQIVPLKLVRIIHLNDPASKVLAQLIATTFDLQNVVVSAFEDIQKDISRHRIDSGSTLVVAGAVATGRGLLSVSQALRIIQTNGAVTYFAMFSRTQDALAYKELKSNICFGDSAEEYGFHVLYKLFLPSSERGRTSWDAELDYLYELSEFSQGIVKAAIEARINDLSRSQSDVERGLSSNLYWCSPSGQKLVLRPGFAFFEFDYSELNVSQADVFFTIVGILHHLRFKADRKRSLRKLDFVRSLISPRCFDRFNDGVIQASFLRACDAGELDYSVDTSQSRSMRQVLEFIFKNQGSEAGEATLEFLIAIGLKRLKLCDGDLKYLFHEFGKSGCQVAQFLWGKINEQLLT